MRLVDCRRAHWQRPNGARRRGAERRPSPHWGDSGYTLVEVVISVVLIGTVVLSILAAVQTGIMASSNGRRLAQIQTVVLNVADRVNRAPKGCGHMSGGSYVPYYEQFVMPAVRLQWPDYTGEVTVTERRYVPPIALPNEPTLQHSGTWVDGGCSLNDA